MTYFKFAIFYFLKKYTFQIASLLVFALVFIRICWIYVIHSFTKVMHFVYIVTYLDNMLIIEKEINNLILA